MCSQKKSITDRLLGDNITEAANDPPKRGAIELNNNKNKYKKIRKKRKRNDDENHENTRVLDVLEQNEDSESDEEPSSSKRHERTEHYVASIDKYQENALLERVMAESMCMSVRAYRAHMKAQRM